MKFIITMVILAGLSACSVAESSFDSDGVGQTYLIDHSAYIGRVYWQ